MPIHDQSYRHFEGAKAPPGRAWLVIAKAGIMNMIRKRLFLGLLLVSWMPFLVRAGQIYFSTNFPQMAMLAPTAETFREFLEQQDRFVFFMTIYVGAGLIANDRRANALQIYLSKPLLRSEYIAGKAAVLFFFLLLITLVPAILLLLVQVMFAGNFQFLRKNLFLFPAITVASLLQVLLVDIHDAGAVVALEEQPLRGDPLCRNHLLHRGRLQVLLRDHRQLGVLVAVADHEPVAGRRRHLPRAAALHDALAGVAHRHRRADRGVDFDSRAARARRRGGHVSAAVAARAVPIVTADHVSKWYGQVIGLNDVSVKVPPGVTGLLGPNGAGKSTFMKLITGQLKPSKGTVTVLGEPIWGNPKLYFQIGFCPEQDAFYERMTGLEWVTALVRLNGLDEKAADEAARRALTMVDLMDAANKKIGAYSKGMRQRVKLAQAIVHDPALLILDEPLSGMDPLARRRTIRLIRDWARAGKSIIVSSHILHEIESMTANILLINNGRILAEGDVHHIRDLIDEHPHTVYVRAAASARPRPRVPGARRCAELAVRAGCRGHRDREAGSVLRAADRHGGDR